MGAAAELLSSHGAFGGRQQFFRHDSRETGLPMRFETSIDALDHAPQPEPFQF